jgi:hypothetical protein
MADSGKQRGMPALTAMPGNSRMLARLRCSIFLLCMAVLPVDPANAQLFPPGSYIQTCGGLKMSGGRLVAQCKDRGGIYRKTSLDRAFDCAVGIENINGSLVCDSWPDQSQRALPPGSYLQTCSDANLSGDTLTAQCKDRSQTLHQTFLTRASHCNRGIENIEGRLACPRLRIR